HNENGPRLEPTSVFIHFFLGRTELLRFDAALRSLYVSHANLLRRLDQSPEILPSHREPVARSLLSRAQSAYRTGRTERTLVNLLKLLWNRRQEWARTIER